MRPLARLFLQVGGGLLAVGPGSRAWALDKQGSAHGGAVAGATQGVSASGSLMTGVALYNESYAARPDNSGLVLMRYAAHGDLDLIGQRLSIPVDINLFSDRLRGGGAKLAPSEIDLIAGLTSTWAFRGGAIEIGSRVEHDRGTDRSPASQTYADLRTRYLFALDDQLRGAATLGWFAYNPSYFARPDNSGKALFRYGCHL